MPAVYPLPDDLMDRIWLILEPHHAQRVARLRNSQRHWSAVLRNSLQCEGYPAQRQAAKILEAINHKLSQYLALHTPHAYKLEE